MFHEKYLAQGSICGIDEFMRVKRGSGRFAVVESMGTVMRFGHIGLRRAMWESVKPEAESVLRRILRSTVDTGVYSIQ